VDNETDKIIEREANDLAHEHDVDPRRVHVVFDRMLTQFGLAPALPATAQSIWPHSVLWHCPSLSEALGYLQPEVALALFEQSDLVDLLSREVATDYLTNAPLFHPLPEVADDIDRFVDHLNANRVSLIATGLPQTSFRHSWPARRLTYLYPIKRYYTYLTHFFVDGEKIDPLESLDLLIDRHANVRPITELRSYVWRQPPDASTDVPSVGPSTPFEEQEHWLPCSYDDAPLIGGLDATAAARIEAGRPALLDLKIAVLGRLARALRTRDASSLWSDCLEFLREAVLADEAAFYLQIDRLYNNSDILIERTTKETAPHYLPGGLTNLLEVIGHCEQELTIGTLGHIRRQVPSAVLGDESFRSYYQAVGQSWQGELDRALDQVVELEAKESIFWDAFRTRVNEAIENELYAEIVIRTKVNQKLAQDARFEPFIRSFVDWQRNHLLATGHLAPVSLGSMNTPPPPAVSTRTIRTDGRVRTFAFEGEEIHLRDSKGLRYLTHLLLHPNQDIYVVDLVRHVDHRGAEQSAIPREDADDEWFQLDRGEGTGPALDKDAKDAYRARARHLQEELSEAREAADEATVEQLLEELEWIESQLTNAVGLRGRDRPQNSDAERARSNISKQINEAFKQIAENHPQLGLHLNYVQLGLYCGYYPGRDQLRWTLLGSSAASSRSL
jgi:hypothetical protein